MNIEQFFLENPYAHNTEDRYRRAITGILAAYHDLQDMTAAQFLAWLDSHSWASSTRWIVYSGIRKYLAWQYGPDHPALRLRIRRDECPPQRSLNASQAAELLEIFESTPKGIRDKAIAALMLDTGLRSSEVCNMEMTYFKIHERFLSVRCKGGKWGDAIFSTQTQEFLSAWLDIRPRYALDTTVFVGIGGGTPGYRLTRDGLRVIVRKWGQAIGLTLSPHDFRRSFAMLSTRAGVPARVLQVAGRWRDMETVFRYTRQIDLSVNPRP